MTTEELKLECLKLALDYAKYVEKHVGTYYTVNGIIDNAGKFFTFVSINKEETK